MKTLRFHLFCFAVVFLNACTLPNVAVPSPAQPVVVTQQAPLPTATASCPTPDSTVDFAPQFFAPGLGHAPTWAVFSNNGRVSLSDVGQDHYAKHGAPIKLLWVVEQKQSDPVTITGTNIQTGERLWFEINGQHATTSVMLDPKQPALPFQREGYAEFPSYLLVSKPGCYGLHATSASENTIWQRNFVVTK